MKQGLQWHKECLKNRESHLEREEQELDRLLIAIERSRQEVALYKAQIKLAEKEGKDGFDSERYAIKRLCV